MKAKIIKTLETIEVTPVYRDEEGKIWRPQDIDLEEEIKELSRKYAEDMCPPEDYLDEEERETDMGIYRDDAFCVLEWLMGGV